LYQYIVASTLHCINTILEETMDHGHSLRHDALAYLDTQAPLPALAVVALRVAVTVTKWSTRARTRKSLKNLDPHILKDIGKTPEEAWREAALPFWRD
jgi:uncharacterized protein YjiS (DUF1127 family)